MIIIHVLIHCITGKPPEMKEWGEGRITTTYLSKKVVRRSSVASHLFRGAIARAAVASQNIPRQRLRDRAPAGCSRLRRERKRKEIYRQRSAAQRPIAERRRRGAAREASNEAPAFTASEAGGDRPRSQRGDGHRPRSGQHMTCCLLLVGSVRQF